MVLTTVSSGHVAAQSDYLVLDQVFAVGVADGPENQMFGMVVDAVTDSRGYTYVLDRYATHLNVYAPDGAFVTATGRSGEGPGEYGYPLAIERAGGGLIHALDLRNTRIYAYRLQGNELVLVRSTRVPYWIVDFCVLEGIYYALGYQPGGIIHELDQEGSVVRSFGKPFIEDPAGLEDVDTGELICIADPATFVVAAAQVPLVRRYSSAGELVWSTTLKGFNRLTIESLPNGRRRFSAPEGGGIPDVTVTASHLGRGVLLVQFGSAGPGIGDLEAIDDVMSVFLSLESGRELHRERGLSKVEYADGSRMIETAAHPFPRVTVYRYEVPIER